MGSVTIHAVALVDDAAEPIINKTCFVFLQLTPSLLCLDPKRSLLAQNGVCHSLVRTSSRYAAVSSPAMP